MTLWLLQLMPIDLSFLKQIRICDITVAVKIKTGSVIVEFFASPTPIEFLQRVKW